MGDVAVGARSGQGGEEHRGHPAESADQAADSAVPSGSEEQAGEDGRVSEDSTAGRGGAPKAEPKPPRSFWKELPILIGIALVLALLIKTFLVQAFSIPSDSMQNTLQQGDRVLVDKLTPGSGPSPSVVRSSSSTTPTTGWRASRRPTRTPAEGAQLDRSDAVRRGEGPDQAGRRGRR
ncbi:hypothetical protein SHKM778_20760 [Streptomyces sp. KM77-8]|uniref:Peptidase S26 domain-containing protein n=1 Tax=Streptomyces haneummycinicus TaxID=3074435 RepID=A0AAT9HE22_9ACTN